MQISGLHQPIGNAPKLIEPLDRLLDEPAGRVEALEMVLTGARGHCVSNGAVASIAIACSRAVLCATAR